MREQTISLSKVWGIEPRFNCRRNVAFRKAQERLAVLQHTPTQSALKPHTSHNRSHREPERNALQALSPRDTGASSVARVLPCKGNGFNMTLIRLPFVREVHSLKLISINFMTSDSRSQQLQRTTSSESIFFRIMS